MCSLYPNNNIKEKNITEKGRAFADQFKFNLSDILRLFFIPSCFLTKKYSLMEQILSYTIFYFIFFFLFFKKKKLKNFW